MPVTDRDANSPRAQHDSRPVDEGPVTIHAIPDDVIAHDHSDDCLCGPTQTLAWSNGRQFWIAYHHPLIESAALERWSC